MKKLFCTVLSISILFLSMLQPTFATTNTDTPEEVVYTSFVLVENGIPRKINEEEYYALLSQTEPDNSHFEELCPAPLLNQENVPVDLSYALQYYTFTPASKREYSATSLKCRVSTVYTNAASVAITTSRSYTRTVTNTAGVSFTATIWDTVDTQVNAAYSYSVSAASEISAEIAATLPVSGRYTYSCVTFVPRLSEVTGRLDLYNVADGYQHWVAAYTGVTLLYPVSSSRGFLDGIYAVAESNNSETLFNIPLA